MRGSRRRHAGDLSAERLGQRVRRGGRAGLAELAQVQRAEDHAQAPGTGRHPACQGWLGLRAGGRTGAATRRHPGTQAALQRFLLFAAGQHPARAGHPQPGVHRHRHQCVRGIDPARRLSPGVLRCGAGRCHAPGRAGIRPAGGAVQHRDVLRLGLQRRRLLPELRDRARGGGRQLLTSECPTAAPAEASAGFA